MSKNSLKLSPNMLKIFTVFLCIGGILFAINSSLRWYFDFKDTNGQIQKIQEVFKSNEIKSSDRDILINPPSDTDSPYWEYIKMSMLDVDLNELRKINSETKGWIQVQGTNISYPFVQHSDNSFYLNHSFNQKVNGAGWPFIDYRNDIDTIDKNNIIYAHGRINSVLFGTLKNIMKDNWYENTDNHIVKLSTDSHNSLWQVFSVYRIPTTSDYILTDFTNDDTYKHFLSFVKERSIYNFEVDLTSEDKILTLSTCYSSTDKVVMHAKLIKIYYE